MSSSPFPWSIRKFFSLVINECSYNRIIFVVDQVFFLFRSKSHLHRAQPNLSSRQSAATRDLLVRFTEGLSGLMVDLSHRFEMTVFLFGSTLFSIKNTMTVILSEAEGSPANPITVTGYAMAYN